jgi:hypothetical protein
MFLKEGHAAECTIIIPMDMATKSVIYYGRDKRAPIGSDTRLGVITLFYGQGMPSHVDGRGLLTYNSSYEHIRGMIHGEIRRIRLRFGLQRRELQSSWHPGKFTGRGRKEALTSLQINYLRALIKIPTSSWKRMELIEGRLKNERNSAMEGNLVGSKCFNMKLRLLCNFFLQEADDCLA